jgi:hypothetical protein
MNTEFKTKNYKDATVYVLESASGGGTSAGSVATVSKPLGKDQLVMQSRMGPKEAPKPRNFVAKNAKMGGAGQHKDKKKAEKQGDVKHRKPFAESQVDEIIDPSTMTAKALRYVGRKFSQAFPWLAVGGVGAGLAASGLLAPLVASAGSVATAISALGAETALAAGVAGTYAAPSIIQTIKDLFSADENSIQAGIKQWVEKQVGDDNDVQEFILIHAKAAYLNQTQFRWRAKGWPVKMTKDQAEAHLEKNDKFWLEQEKQKAADAEKVKQDASTQAPGETHQMKATEFAEAGYGRNRGYTQGFASPTAPSLGGNKYDSDGNQLGGGHDEYHVPDPVDNTIWFIRVNGKILHSKDGSPYEFRSKDAATKAARTMMAKPFNAGKKFELTTRYFNDQHMKENAHSSEHFMDIVDATNGDVRGIMQELRSSGLHSEIIAFCQWARGQGIADIKDAIKLAKQVGLENDDEEEMAYEGYILAKQLLMPGVSEVAQAKTDDAYLAYLAKKKAEKNNNWHPSKHVTDPQKKKELAPHDKDVKRGSYADRAAYLTKGGVSEDHNDMGKGYSRGSLATAYNSSALAGAGHDDRTMENPDWYNDEANSMTTAQLKSLVKHASKLRAAVKAMGTDTLEPWQQAKVTKAADYLDAVFNAVDDEHDMGEGSHPDEKEDKELIRKMVKQQALKQEDSYMAELFDKLAEKIPANAPVDRWIKDFDKASKTPNAKGHHQFKNKSPDKVRQMAIAASYGAKNPKKKK